MKLLDYIVLIFIIIILFMAVACQTSEDTCKDYRLEQNQKIDCTEDCVTIITTIEYCSQ